jgi:hypothetical protein
LSATAEAVDDSAERRSVTMPELSASKIASRPMLMITIAASISINANPCWPRARAIMV